MWATLLLNILQHFYGNFLRWNSLQIEQKKNAICVVFEVEFLCFLRATGKPPRLFFAMPSKILCSFQQSCSQDPK